MASTNENLAPAFRHRGDDLAVAVGGVTADQDSFAPAAFAVLMASVTMLAAPLPEPAFPARSRIPATTGAAVGC